MNESLVELQSQRDALKENLQDVNENIKKLTGRDPAENRRPLANQRRFQLKRTSLGGSSNNQPPEKRPMTERRRWGSTVGNRNKKKLDSGGEEEEEEIKKPAVHSSVVATGKPIEAPKRPQITDKASVNRNKRMLGVLMGTLKQFKRENQYKSEQETKREEKLTKVEEQVEKEKEEVLNEKKELYNTRKTKQQELRKLEFKIDMAELNVELKQHYENLKDFIQLKSTPRVFYKPAKHNAKTLKLLEESQEQIKESLEQRLKEIEMCTEEDISAAARITNSRRQSRVSKNVIIIEPKQSKRDLFAEDEDDDQRQREADSSAVANNANASNDDDDDVIVIEQETSSKVPGKVLNGSVEDGAKITPLENVQGVEEEKDTLDEMQELDSLQDSRRVVEDSGLASSVVVPDERVVEFSGSKSVDGEEVEAVDGTDDVNIYADMQRNIESFTAE